MRIGLGINYAGGFKEVAAEVADLERAGLDIVFVPEAYSYDAVSALGYLAASTERVELASGILQLYTRTPTLTAMTAAGLDYVSDGRFTLDMTAPAASRLEYLGLIAAAPWPEYDPALVEDEERVLPVQINGKRRGEIRATAGASESEVEKIVLDDPEIARRLEGLSIRRVIVVKDPEKRRALRDLYLTGWYEYLAMMSAGLVPWAPVTDRVAEAEAASHAPELAERAAAQTAAGSPGMAEALDLAPAVLVVVAVAVFVAVAVAV